MSAIVEVEVAGRSYRLRSDEGGADLEGRRPGGGRPAGERAHRRHRAGGAEA